MSASGFLLSVSSAFFFSALFRSCAARNTARSGTFKEVSEEIESRGRKVVSMRVDVADSGKDESRVSNA